jgi:uncharacterized C2H2 Zn-finger protein
MAMAFPDDFRREMKRVIAGKRPKYDVDWKGTQRSFDQWPKHLRYCPDCTREDISIYGEAYWHRTHQLPGMVYCTKHFVRLEDSQTPMRKTTTSYHPASSEISLGIGQSGVTDDLWRHKEKFLAIARESVWLLNHGMNVDWNFDFQTKYKRMLRDLGVVTVQGVSDYDLIASSFNDYWGEGFLRTLFSSMSDTRDWIRQLYAAQIKTFKPIYHILLMCFLRGSVKAFLESEPSENPFGEYPWPCENPICEHYNVDGCKNTEIRIVSGVAVGFFRCDRCGMVYKQIRRTRKTGAPIIVDYGHLWKNVLSRCTVDDKMTVEETAGVLKCEPHIVSFQRRKIGIVGNQKHTRKPPDLTKKSEFLSFHKAIVLRINDQNQGVTFSMLRDNAPGTYAYLSKRDPEWLREHLIRESERPHCIEADRLLLERIKAAVDWIRNEGDWCRRITRGYIASVAGVHENDLKPALFKRHQITLFLDAVIESKEEWLRRRFAGIWENQKENGKLLALADIRREMRLKPNTYVKHKDYIKELIDELNKDF